MEYINETEGRAEKTGGGIGKMFGDVLRATGKGLVGKKTDKKDAVSRSANFVSRGLNTVGGGIVDFIKGAGKGAWKGLTTNEQLMVHLYTSGLTESLEDAYDISLHLSEDYREYFHSILVETYEN